jgi:hypothetical protein
LPEWDAAGHAKPQRGGIDFPRTSGGFFASRGLGEHAHDVALLHDQILDAIDLDLGTGPFAEQDSIAGLQVDGNELSGLVAPDRKD